MTKLIKLTTAIADLQARAEKVAALQQENTTQTNLGIAGQPQNTAGHLYIKNGCFLYTASLWTSFAMLVCSASSPWLTNMYSVHIATPTQHSVGSCTCNAWH